MNFQALIEIILKDFEKILLIVDNQDITTGEIERKASISPGSLTHLIDRKGNLHPNTSLKIQRAFRIRSEWWDTQKGAMYEVESDDKLTSVPNSESKTIATMADSIFLMQKQIDALTEELRKCEAKVGAVKGL